MTDSAAELPGQYPYTRGIYPDMYRGRLWTMRQYAGFGTAEESNRRYRYLLSQGITGLSVAFDLPTQMGMDSDHPLAAGEVGRVGVAICSLADMQRLFDGIRLADITTSMTINSTAAILLSFYVLVARSQGADLRKLSGTIQNDILKEYIARGTYIYPPRPAMRIITDLFALGRARSCRSGTPSPSAAITFAKPAPRRFRKWPSRWPTPSPTSRRRSRPAWRWMHFAPRLSFFFNAHNNFLEEIAKFRAARRLVRDIMRDRFGARNPRSMMLRFHVQTAGSTLDRAAARRQRGARFDAGAGGGAGRRAIAAHQCQGRSAVAAHRGIGAPGAADAADHRARKRRDRMRRIRWAAATHRSSSPTKSSSGAREYIERIDAMGGTLAAIEKHYIQNEIQNAAYEYQQAVERGEAVVVGVNRFKQDEGEAPAHFRLDPELEQQQIARVREVRASRDGAAVEERLRALEKAARSSDNLMPHILSCAEAHATVGEISDRLRAVFGEYREAMTRRTHSACRVRTHANTFFEPDPGRSQSVNAARKSACATPLPPSREPRPGRSL